MKKQEIIEALKVILEALEGGEKVSEVTKESSVAEVKKDEKKEAVSGELSVKEEELKEMKYADLKKLASEMGVSAKGKRDEIIARLLAENVEITVEEVEEDTSDDEEMGKVIEFPKKKEIDYLALAKEATEDMSLDEIRETLEDLELDSTGKKKELIDRIAKAMEEGIIEIEDDDTDEEEDVDEPDVEEDEVEEDDSDDSEEDDEDDEEEEDDDSDDEEDDEDSDDDEDEDIDENTYFDEYDDGSNDPEEVDSEERRKAMVKLQKEIINDYENEALQDKDIDDFLKKYLTEDELEDDYEDADEMEKFAIYCELMKRMIDDDGERIPMGEPYEITVDGDTYDYCCGHELEETDEGYVCEVCGNTYESEE